MGFTRYWTNIEITEDLVEATKKIIETSNVSIKGGLGEGEPVVTTENIIFNGDADLEEDYETFFLESSSSKRPDWFCKTQYRPYDDVVTAVLLAASALDDKVEISSDGYFPYDYTKGIALYKKAIGPIPDKVLEKLRTKS